MGHLKNRIWGEAFLQCALKTFSAISSHMIKDPSLQLRHELPKKKFLKNSDKKARQYSRKKNVYSYQGSLLAIQSSVWLKFPVLSVQR